MKYLSVDVAAQIVGVSSATMRNWVKAGEINPVSLQPLMFLEQNILHLKAKIGSEHFARLRTRANKLGAKSNFLPDEYAENPELISYIRHIVEYVKKEKLEISLVMYLAALRLLEMKGEVSRENNDEIFNLESHCSWTRQSIKSVIYEWRASFDTKIDIAKYHHLYKLILPQDETDFLGLLYQSIVVEGDKSKKGSYYTPTKLVMDSLSDIEGLVENFLDPCCGTGKYLLLAARKFRLDPQNIFGVDCDKIAIYIARINLLLNYEGKEFLPNIFCLDSLTEFATGEIFCNTNNYIEKIDLIATNPPWGAYKNSKVKTQVSARVKSGETFSLFLEKSIKLLRHGGRLTFILPESILKIKTHSDIRSVILNETTISKISLLGRQFTGVFTPVIRLDLKKDLPKENWLVSIEQNSRSALIEQQRFKNNDNFTFDIGAEAHEKVLLDKIYDIDHLTLLSNADWALGIVTGDNKKYVLDSPENSAEAVYRGSDVSPYNLGQPKSFLHFRPKVFQQVASERFYRAPEKLIYKFISNKLIFAYDNRQCLTLNSANILIPNIPGIRIKVVLAFLNSSVFQYIFSKKFSTHKVLRGDLETLPFPQLDVETQNKIEQFVDIAINTGKVPAELEETIFAAFNFNEEDIPIINQTITK